MSEIKDLMKTIKEKKELAQQHPGNNPLNYNTKLGHIKRAKQDLEELYLEYRKLIQQQMAFILVTGSKKQIESFAETSKEKFSCFVVDSEDFYNKIADEVHPRLYNNAESGSALFDILGSIFEGFAMDIGIIGYNALIFNQKYKTTLKNKSDLVSLIKRAFNEKIGSELVGYYTIDSISRKAVNEDFDGSIVPVIMKTYDQELVKELTGKLINITPNVFVVSVGSGNIDDEIKNKSIACVKKSLVDNVESTLVKIKENLR